MKKNVWKELKKENNAKALNLEIEDQRYLDKVTAYAVNQGVGMMETEIIRKDLIGIAEEAKYYICLLYTSNCHSYGKRNKTICF